MATQTLITRHERCIETINFGQFNIDDTLSIQIQNLLTAWATSIPQSALQLYGESLNRAIHFITQRRFILHNISISEREITVTYLNDDEVVYQITILSHKVLLLDIERGSKEGAYPTVWTPDNFCWFSCQTEEDKIECYKEFLDSKTHRLLIIVGAGARNREPLLRRCNIQRDIVILQEGCGRRVIESAEPCTASTEHPIMKTIIYRSAFNDPIVRAYHFTSPEYCMRINFVNEESCQTDGETIEDLD